MHVWQVSDVVLGTRRANARQSLFVWCSQVVQDLVELVDVVAALEERLASQQLCENASYRPNIDYAGLACAQSVEWSSGDCLVVAQTLSL